MDSDQLQMKKILVDLEDEHKHLQASIGHLEHEIKKREIDIRKLLAERELKLAQDYPDYRKRFKTSSAPQIEEKVATQFSSEFAEQVSKLLNSIKKTSEEVSSLIKL